MKPDFSYNYCPKCGKSWIPEANYCSGCGHTKIEEECPESDYLSLKPITLLNFFPRLFSAVENVSLRDFFMMFSTAGILFVRPFSYLQKQDEGKVIPVFASLMMATFAGTFKCFQDPVYGPMLHKLDMNNQLSETIVQFVLYLSLASLFGLFAFLVSKLAYRILNLTAVKEDVFVRAMLVLFNVSSFIFDAFSPFWMPFVYSGVLPWGILDLVRGAVILAYVPIVYHGLAQQSASMKKS